MVSSPGVEFAIRVDGFQTGLAGTIGYEIVDSQTGATVIARTTNGIVEAPAGAGSYGAAIRAPKPGDYVVIWDPGELGPDKVAAQQLEVTEDGRPAPILGGALFTRIFYGLPSGLVGTAEARIEDADGTVTLTPRTEGVAELLAGSGVYAVTEPAPADPGEYVLVIDTGVLSPSSTATRIFTVSAEAANFVPTLAEVGELITQRTKDANGNETGTFTPATRPSDAQVQGLIDKAVGRLAGRVGSSVDPSLIQAATEVVALDVACRVELSFFPDQGAVQRSAYAELKALRDAQESELLSDYAALGAATGESDPLSPTGLPAFSFPSLAPLDSFDGGSEIEDPFRQVWS